MAVQTRIREEKASIIEKFGSAKDTGSSEAQIALLTAHINALNVHFQTNAKDHQSRRGLLKMVGQRRRLLTYLKRSSLGRYQNVIQALELRK